MTYICNHFRGDGTPRDLRTLRASTPISEEGAPEVGSVEFIRGWTIEELGRLVREGRDLGFYDRDPMMMCDLSGRLSDVPPLTLSDRVRRRLVGMLPDRRPPPIKPPQLTHHSTDTPPVSPSSGGRLHGPCPSVTPAWTLGLAVSGSARRPSEQTIGSLAKPCQGDASVRGERGLMPTPDGGAALAFLVDRVCR